MVGYGSNDNWQGDRDQDESRGKDWRRRALDVNSDNRYKGVKKYGSSRHLPRNDSNNYNHGGSKRSKQKIIVGPILGLLVVGIIFGISSGMFDINFDGIGADIEAEQNTQQNTESQLSFEKVDSGITIETINSPITSNTITYTYSSPPSVGKKQIVYSAIDKAFSNWETANPELDFEFTNSRSADIVIEWEIYSSSDHSGLAEISFINGEQIIGEGSIIASLGADDCKGLFVHHDTGSMTNILMHEIGHIIGLTHHMDKTHLMYGKDFVAETYDTRDYQIPKRLDDYYYGYKTLQGQAESQKEEIDDLQNEHDQLYSQYQKYEGKELPQEEYDEAIKMKIELDRLGSQLGERIDSYNEIVNQLNCFPNTGS